MSKPTKIAISAEVKEEESIGGDKPNKGKRIRGFGRGRPRQQNAQKKQLPDFLNIHEQTVLLALLWIGWNLPGEHGRTTGYLEQEGGEDLSYHAESFIIIMDGHEEFQQAPELRQTLIDLIDGSEAFSRLLERLAWLCPKEQFSDMLLLYAVMFAEVGARLMSLPEDTPDHIIAFVKASVQERKTRLWDLLRNLSFQNQLAIEEDQSTVIDKFQRLMLILLCTAVLTLKNINENPFYRELYSELQGSPANPESIVKSRRKIKKKVESIPQLAGRPKRRLRPRKRRKQS